MTHPLGYVETQRAVLFPEGDPLRLRSGAELHDVEVAYETYGELSPDGDNAVFVCHALTGDAHAAGLRLGEKRRGWWDNLIGRGKALDTDRYFVICANMLGGCSGTTGPQSIDPQTGKPYGPDFPLLHMSDVVAVHRRLLDQLGVERLHAAVGGSLGGMQVLQWVIDAPEQIERAVIVAASSQLTTENIAFSAVARQAIMGDPQFHGGRYRDHGVTPAQGMKVARMMAHITYVSPQVLSEKFGRRRREDDDAMRMGPDFEVEHYLQYQGDSFVERFDALSYLALSRLLDYFDPFGEPETLARLRRAMTRFRVLSFDSDWRFSTAQSQRMVDALRGAGCEVAFDELSAPFGHDSFLLESPGYHDAVREFVAGD